MVQVEGCSSRGVVGRMVVERVKGEEEVGVEMRIMCKVDGDA
jgi:hypothetical protein